MSTLSTKLEEVTEAVDIIAFGGQLKHIHEIIVQAAHNEYLRLSIAPLQGLSRRFWFANIKDPEIELRRASSLHRSTLLAISTGDEQAATSASLALNDYLTEFTYRTLHTAVSS